MSLVSGLRGAAMFRALLLLVVGSVAGAAAAYMIWPSAGTGGAAFPDPVDAYSTGELSPSGPSDASGASGAPAPDDGTPGATDESHAGFASLRLSFFQQAVAITDPDELERRVLPAAAQPRSRIRDAEMTALLLRYAELDPARATAFAWTSNLETRFVASLMRVWASADDRAAIAWLVAMSPSVDRRQLALAVLDVLGHDPRSVARVAAGLPASDRSGLEMDVLLLRAENDPAGVLRTLMAMDESVRVFALSRIAPVITRSDPRQALTVASAIEDASVRGLAMNLLLSAWAEADPEAMFTMLESLYADHDESDPVMRYLRSGGSLLGMFQRIADGDPERLLRLADQFPSSLRGQAHRAALQAMATTNPQGAIARIDLLPLGQERSSLMNSIASAWGRMDPRAALAWARSLSPASPEALRGVINGIASVNFDVAIDVIQTELDRSGAGVTGAGFARTDLQLAMSLLSGMNQRIFAGSADPSDVVRIANRLLEVDHPTMQMALSSALGMWAATDAESALAWVIANESRLDASALMTMAQQVVQSDQANRAMEMTDNVPPQVRAGWIQGVSAGLANYSVDQAVAFLERYRGQPGYDASINNVVTNLAQRDPVSAAQMIGRLQPGPQLNQAAVAVASSWARQDPQAAAQWAAGVPDERVQSATFGSIASTWATSDADAALAWITTLQTGAARDQAITGLLTATAARGQLDVGLIGMFSSDLSRENALNGIIVQLSRTNPSQARSLLDTWVTDPRQRERIERNMARMATAPAMLDGVRIVLP